MVEIVILVLVAGFVLAAFSQNPYLAMAALTLAFAGIKSTVGPFWAIGTAFLSSTAAAGGIAAIGDAQRVVEALARL